MIELTKMSNFTFRIERALFAGFALAFLIKFIQQGLVQPGQPHESSFTFLFLFGIYMISGTYYHNIKSKTVLIQKILDSIIALGFVTFAIEGTWDIVYAIKYYFSTNPALLTGVLGGIAIMVMTTTIFIAFRSYRLFNIKRIGLGLFVLFMYYTMWYLQLGFDTSGAPNFSSSIYTGLVEIGHWGLGVSLFAWSLKHDGN